MNVQDACLAAGLRAAMAVTGRPVVYHRYSQAIPITAIKSHHQVATELLIREWQSLEQHFVNWRFDVVQLAALQPPTTEDPDWIQDADGSKYAVVRVQEDQDWEYITPDKTWVRVRTQPIT